MMLKKVDKMSFAQVEGNALLTPPLPPYTPGKTEYVLASQL